MGCGIDDDDDDDDANNNNNNSNNNKNDADNNNRLNKIYNWLKNFTNQLLDNIWGDDLVDMQLISKFTKGFRFLLCIIDIFSEYAWVVPLKDKKGISIVNAFQKILDNSAELRSMELRSEHKPNKIWVDKGRKFYNNSFKKWLKDNDIEMYSVHNEGKSVVAETFIRTLKNKNT